MISLMSVLASGILIGPAGEEIRTDGNLITFFQQIREWYGHDPTLTGSFDPPTGEQFDLGLELPDPLRGVQRLRSVP